MDKKISLKSICAINNLGYIAKDGKIPWHSSEDFKHFKTLTKGATCICGSTTFENDFGSKGLPGRKMFVVGRNYLTPFEALTEAVAYNKETFPEQDTSIWIIGGNQIYTLFNPFISEMHLSVINDDTEGDLKLNMDNMNKNAQLSTYNFEVNQPKEV